MMKSEQTQFIRGTKLIVFIAGTRISGNRGEQHGVASPQEAYQ